MMATLLDGVRERCAHLSDRELDERIRSIEEQRRRLDAELAATLAAAEGRALYTADAHRSMRGYCRATMNWSGPETTFWVRAERLVRDHPEVGDAWAAGRIGASHLRLFTQLHVDARVRDRLGDFVPQLLQNAEELSYPDFAKVVERLIALSDQGAPIVDESPEQARTALAVDVHGSLEVRASGGDPLATSEFLAILRRFTDAEFRRDVECGSMRTSGQRRFDALVAIARAAASHEGLVTRSDPLVSIVVDERTWSDVLLHSGLGSGTSLNGVKSVPIDLGRSARVFTGAARDAAKLLMRWCDHPGCDLPADWCQVDHSVEWLHDGRTDQDNAGSECGFHNRAKHRKRFRTRRAQNGRVYTHRPDGTIMLPVGVRPPRFEASDDEPEHERRFRIEATCHHLRVWVGHLSGSTSAA